MNRFVNITFALFTFLIVNSQTVEIPFVYNLENTGYDCEKPPLISPSQITSESKLTDPFEWSYNSGRCQSFSDWTCRRAEIKAEIEYRSEERRVGNECVSTWMAGMAAAR